MARSPPGGGELIAPKVVDNNNQMAKTAKWSTEFEEALLGVEFKASAAWQSRLHNRHFEGTYRSPSQTVDCPLKFPISMHASSSDLFAVNNGSHLATYNCNNANNPF